MPPPNRKCLHQDQIPSIIKRKQRQKRGPKKGPENGLQLCINVYKGHHFGTVFWAPFWGRVFRYLPEFSFNGVWPRAFARDVSIGRRSPSLTAPRSTHERCAHRRTHRFICLRFHHGRFSLGEGLQYHRWQAKQCFVSTRVHWQERCLCLGSGNVPNHALHYPAAKP